MRYWIRDRGNLTMYSEKPDERYWTEQWAKETFFDLAERTKENKPILVKAFSKYLPRQGKILEAGCGLGPWVKILLDEGYDIEGVDISKATIERAKSSEPWLPVSVGNVLTLDYPSEYFDGYISLGVVEHFEDGPTAMLLEARRVLKQKGILMISFPHFNPVRMATIMRRRCQKSNPGCFFQYAFTTQKFRAILSEQGFTPLATVPYSTWYIKKEMPVISNIISRLYQGEKPDISNNTGANNNKKGNKGNIFKRMLKKLVFSYLVMYFAGHTMMLVAVKSGK